MKKKMLSPAKKLKSELEKCKNAGLKVRPAKRGELQDYAGMNDKAGSALGHPIPAKTIIWDDKLPIKDQVDTVKHELHERKDMAKGMNYWKAHTRALACENPLAHQNPVIAPVYHGTPAYLDDATKLHKGKDSGIHFGTEAQAWGRLYHRSGDVIPARVEISNMKRERDTGLGWRTKIRLAKEQGYDGIIYLNRYEGLFAHDKKAFIARLIERGYPSEAIKEMVRRSAYTMHRPAFFNNISDEEFLDIFPEAEDSYIVFSTAQVKPYTGWKPLDQLPTGVRA